MSELPQRLEPYFTEPTASRVVSVGVRSPANLTVATRLYAVDDACARLEVVSGQRVRALVP